MKKWFLLLFIVFGNTVLAQDNEALFNEASQDYADGNYKNAIEKYEAILKNGETSSNLYYNLANAHYKLNHIAPSIYNYEKALLLNPANTDAENNLVFANSMKLDAIEDLPKSSLSKIMNGIISNLSFNGWAWLAVIASFVLVAFFLAYYFTRSILQKRIFFSGFILGIVVMLASVTFAYLQYDIQQKKQFAIVFAEESDILSEPNPSSSNAFTLHEGTKIKVLDAFNGFYKIELADGRQGWVKESEVEKL
jgi:tetratricopeptide (TPR) repeat protein